jgi:XTP/dITP diphosphohydrolase
VIAAGVPVDLLPEDMAALGAAQGGDAENALRAATLQFMNAVRNVEAAVAAARRGTDTPAELDAATLGRVSEDEWRTHWPTFAESDEGDDADEGGEGDEGGEASSLL